MSLPPARRPLPLLRVGKHTVNSGDHITGRTMKTFNFTKHKSKFPETMVKSTKKPRGLLGLFSFSLTLPLATPLQSSKPAAGPWCQAELDYSAANEYIHAHYGLSPYFPAVRRMEPVYNAREGVFLDNGSRRPASLSANGFALAVQDATNGAASITDWHDMSQIRRHYLPDLRRILIQQYGDKVAHISFWCPTLRTAVSPKSSRSDETTTTPTSGFVATAHIDTDINAYSSMEKLAEMIQKNKLSDEESSNSANTQQLLVRALHKGQRFAIVNAWRNIGSAPVLQAPLAFMPTQYKDTDEAFPNGILDSEHSRWYTYPELTNDELLLFCQYDRDVAFPSDIWHCALVGISDGGDHRQSFDVRCLIVLDEIVPEERDRLSKVHRREPNLSREQSAIFCSEQAERRRRPQ